MNKLTKKQLEQVSIADLSNFDEAHNVFYIKKSPLKRGLFLKNILILINRTIYYIFQWSNQGLAVH